MSPNLAGRVCVVTGATKGIGKGIAVQLGAAGAKVYITGRTKEMLEDCAKEIKERGGTPIPVQVDHSNDKEVEALFKRIKTEQNGRLDLLVNNAYAGVHAISSNKVIDLIFPIHTFEKMNFELLSVSYYKVICQMAKNLTNTLCRSNPYTSILRDTTSPYLA